MFAANARSAVLLRVHRHRPGLHLRAAAHLVHGLARHRREAPRRQQVDTVNIFNYSKYFSGFPLFF